MSDGPRSTRSETRRRDLVIAVAIAVAVHGAVIALIAATWERDQLPPVAEREPATATSESLAAGDIATVELLDDGPLGEPVRAVDGAGDRSSSAGEHPFPNADVDRPGMRPAARGGGSAGGTESFTGRDDDDSARAQMWNHPDRYRLAREDSAKQSSTPESIVRRDETSIADRDPAPVRSRFGGDRSSQGRADGTGSAGSAGMPSRDWVETDPVPVLDDPRAVASRVEGSTRSSRREIDAETGPRATESNTRGAARDSVATASASDELDPAPLELSSPSAGGRGAQGVRGKSRQSGASRRGRGSGSAATRAPTKRGKGGVAVRAGRQNAYFRRMYERVDRVVKYPRDLALALEQGTVVVRFTLRASGEIADISVSKSSGFKEFDRAFTRALRRAAPFGAVPASVLGSARKITVNAPYTFSNPLIR